MKLQGRKSKRNGLIILGVFMAVFAFTFLVHRFVVMRADAASLANFDPGYIISDYQMGNYNAMSEGEIQAFLSAKNPCGNRDYNYYVSLSRNPNYRWHFENGHFVCLSEERFGHNDNEIGFQYGETAAHIIWQAAQDYRINPQVIIVLLQKETGLITDPIPNNGDYRKATGYGCPDTAACSSQYYGFRNQVRNAAALFRTVLDGGWTNYPLGNNYIQYNPNAACGGSVVNIRSRATSALYRYTPYQPNAGALAAGYGTASCGAYGNRNFYLYFEDWFGGVTGEGLKVPETDYVVEGEYTIKSQLGHDMVLDVAGGRNMNGANIQLYNDNDSGAQKWRIQSDGEGSYIFINSDTGKVLDVAAAGYKQGTNVQLYDSNGTCAQKWRILRNADMTYSMYSSCSGMAMDVENGSMNNGSNIQIYQPNGTSAQKWNFVMSQEIRNGEYEISSMVDDNMMLDINGGVSNAMDGTNIQLYQRNRSSAQKWQVMYGDDGYYSIINSDTGRSLDVVNGSVDNNANVQLWGRNDSCAQRWQIVKNNNGGFTIHSACSGLALDVLGGRNVSGTNVQLYSFNQTNAQKWVFNVVQDVPEGDYIIKSALDSSMVMDVAGGMDINGTNIQLFEDNNSDAQRWRILAAGDGYYSIMNPKTNKVLDAEAGGVWDGTNVQLWVSNDTCAQKWQLVRHEDGYVLLYSACSGLLVDVAGGNNKNGANIQLFNYNGSSAQKWMLSGV